MTCRFSLNQADVTMVVVVGVSHSDCPTAHQWWSIIALLPPSSSSCPFEVLLCLFFFGPNAEGVAAPLVLSALVDEDCLVFCVRVFNNRQLV